MAIYPEQLDKLLNKADFFLKKRELKQVLGITNEILGQEPQCWPAAILEADILIHNGNPKAGLAVLDTLSLPEHEKGTSFDEDQLKVMTLKARALLFLKRLHESEKLLQIILNANHEHLEAVEILADLSLDQGNIKKAISIYKALLQKNWQANQILFSLGQAYFTNREYVSAFEAFLKLQKLGVESAVLSKFIENTKIKLAPEAIKHRSNNFIDNILMKAVPSLADDKIMAHFHDRLDDRKTETQFLTDPLSGCFTQAALRSHIPLFHQKVEEHNQIFLALIEIDYLDRINLFYGHDVGNEVIRIFGTFLRESFGKDVFRIKGYQFLMCFEGTDQTFFNLFKKFRAEVEYDIKKKVNKSLVGNLINDEKGQPIKLLWDITCSIGSTSWPAKVPFTTVTDETAASFWQCTSKSVGRNSFFFKTQLVDRGAVPAGYTPGLVKELDKIAIGKGNGTWWELAGTLSPAELRSLLDLAAANREQLKKDEAK